MHTHQSNQASLLILLAGILATGCGGAGSATTGKWKEDRSTVGDVTTVRTLGGSVWGGPARLVEELSIGEAGGADEAYLLGEIRDLAVGNGYIYALDQQLPGIRVFDMEGKHVRTIGRKGSGPGEFSNPESMDLRPSDGYLFVRDGQAGRISYFTPDGEYAGQWPIRSGWQFSDTIFFGPGEVLYQPGLLNMGVPVEEWVFGRVGAGPEGATGDTLRPPDLGFQEWQLVAHSEGGGTSVNTVPFSPQEEWEFGPHGEIVGGISNAYRLEIHHPDGTTTIAERDHDPVPVQPAEKSWKERAAIANMQSMAEGWAWNGPAIPDTKPAWDELLVDEDGRIWVRRQGTGEHQEGCAEDPKPGDSAWWKNPCWIDSYSVDVFRADGSYLGAVETPEGFSMGTPPVIRGDMVVSMATDEAGVPYIKRYRLITP